MKRKYFALVAILVLITTSCKGDKSVDELEVKKTQIADVFKVTVRVIAQKDDSFSLYFSEDGTTNFPAEALWSPFQGSASEQDVVFSLPEEAFPTQIRLDFGMNKEQADIILKSVKFEYKGKTRTIAGAEMGMFFRADHTKCTFDPVTGLIQAIVKNGEKQSPSLYPHEEPLKAELQTFASSM